MLKRVPNLDATEVPDQSQHVDENKVVASLADQVRSIWIEEKQRYELSQKGHQSTYKPGPGLDGGRDGAGTERKPVWPKLAKFIFSNGYDPVAFIRAQFFQCAGRPPLSPNMLVGPVAAARYKSYVDKRSSLRELMIAKDTQIRAAWDAIELNKRLYGETSLDVYRDVILDSNVAITSLFRYMLAHESNLPELINFWEQSAINQYMYDQSNYDRVWGDLIPSRLRDIVKDMRALVSSAAV